MKAPSTMTSSTQPNNPRSGRDVRHRAFQQMSEEDFAG
jgi:hypothetical protein